MSNASGSTSRHSAIASRASTRASRVTRITKASKQSKCRMDLAVAAVMAHARAAELAHVPAVQVF